MTQRSVIELGTRGQSEMAGFSLTKREWETLTMIFRGHTNKEIADLLGIRPQTVKNHTSSLLSKMRAKNRTHAVMIAISRGWGQEILNAITTI